MNIVEYVGPLGVHSTPEALLALRLKTPYAGDVVDFSRLSGYPFKGRWGTIEGVGVHFAKKDEAHVCCEPGSIYLGWDNGRPVASISGGPFECIPLSRLTWSGEFKLQRFWNFGDRGPGAGASCEYWLSRPVWLVLPPNQPPQPTQP